jgi:hypothetical protein
LRLESQEVEVVPLDMKDTNKVEGDKKVQIVQEEQAQLVT